MLQYLAKPFVLLCLVAFSVSALADQVVSPLSSSAGKKEGRYTQFVVAALLKDMELDFDDEKKSEPDREEKKDKEERKPKPKKEEEKKVKKDKVVKKKSEDDFFNDDDGFFDDDDDFDSMSYEDAVASFDKEFEETVKAWDKEYEETVKKWTKAKKIYNKQKEQYAETTYSPASMTATSDSLPLLESSRARGFSRSKYAPGDYHVIPNAMETNIRDQRFRGTCAAFAGIRAVELVLNQGLSTGGSKYDLSEQHFYWLSKKDCQNKPCTIDNASEGSFFDDGFYASMDTKKPNSAFIMEGSCPYVEWVNKGNLTYTPLKQCNSYVGKIRVNKMNTFLRPDQIFDELAANRPVAAGFKLPKSFYETSGVVRLYDPKSQKKGTDKHAGGHAVVLIGYIKLPEKMWAQEGQFCAILANSWGSGYGVGGYSCLTESWMEKYAIRLPRDKSRAILTSVEAVSLAKK